MLCCRSTGVIHCIGLSLKCTSFHALRSNKSFNDTYRQHPRHLRFGMLMTTPPTGSHQGTWRRGISAEEGRPRALGWWAWQLPSSFALQKAMGPAFCNPKVARSCIQSWHLIMMESVQSFLQSHQDPWLLDKQSKTGKYVWSVYLTRLSCKSAYNQLIKSLQCSTILCWSCSIIKLATNSHVQYANTYICIHSLVNCIQWYSMCIMYNLYIRMTSRL